MATENKTPNIVQRLAKVMAEVGAVKKDQVNPQQKYNYRGIDQIYNALHPLLAKNEIAVSCRVKEHTTRDIVSKTGSAGWYVTVLCEYIFTAPDGSQHVTEILAGSSDYSDKAAMQAMSQAQKYALLQVFLIPTEDTQDPDGKTVEAADTFRLRLNEAISLLQKATSYDDIEMVGESFPDLTKNPEFRAAASVAVKKYPNPKKKQPQPTAENAAV